MDITKLELQDPIIKIASSKTELQQLLISLRALNTDKSVVQIFDPEKIVNKIHIIGAYANATLVFENGTNKTKSMAMEMLLFAAMTDQIERALDIVGAKTNSKFILFSNNAVHSKKIAEFISIGKDFSPTSKEIAATAKNIGIDADKVDIDRYLLQKMALSRLSSD